MKNVQVVDGANNCMYEIFSVEDDEFLELFPDGADVEFIEDATCRLGEERISAILVKMWDRPVDKKLVQGIHGTLFCELEYKEAYFPTKREAEAIVLRST